MKKRLKYGYSTTLTQLLVAPGLFEVQHQGTSQDSVRDKPQHQPSKG